MMTRKPYLPCKELKNVILKAYAPCPHFSGACAGIAHWNPARGHVPRGFIGAFGRLEDVELVLLVAEPGSPFETESYPADVDPDAALEACCDFVYKQFESGTDQFHRNIRYILDLCWPGSGIHEQLERAWIAETFMCSAPKEGGSVPARSVRACAQDYLLPQLKLLKDRVIVALGSKAQSRTRNFPGILPAASVAPPGCNFSGARESWERIPGYLRSRKEAGHAMGRRPCDRAR